MSLSDVLVLSGAHLDDVHVWRGGGAEGGHGRRGADLCAAVAVEVLIQPLRVGEKVVVVTLLVTGATASPGDEKEWSVGRQTRLAGLGRPGPGLLYLTT